MKQSHRTPKPDRTTARRLLESRRGIALISSLTTAFVVLAVGTVVAVGADTTTVFNACKNDATGIIRLLPATGLKSHRCRTPPASPPTQSRPCTRRPSPGTTPAQPGQPMPWERLAHKVRLDRLVHRAPPGSGGPAGQADVGLNPGQIAILRWYPANKTGITRSVGGLPVGVAFDGTNIWVANATSGNVTKLNASTGTVVDTYSVGTNPNGVAFDGTNI